MSAAGFRIWRRRGSASPCPDAPASPPITSTRAICSSILTRWSLPERAARFGRSPMSRTSRFIAHARSRRHKRPLVCNCWHMKHVWLDKFPGYLPLVRTVMMAGPCGRRPCLIVAAQPVVSRELRWRQDGTGLDMRGQVDGAQSALKCADLSSCGSYRSGIGAPVTECLLEAAFAFDQFGAERLRCAAHPGKRRLDCGQLRQAQPELVLQLDDVRRARVMVEFGRLGHAHATSLGE